MGIIGVYVFSIVLIGWVDNNKDCFEDKYYNKPNYNFPLVAPANEPEKMQLLSALDVSCLRILLNILLWKGFLLFEYHFLLIIVIIRCILS